MTCSRISPSLEILLLNLCPRIAQSDGAIEDKRVWFGVQIDTEVTLSLKLKPVPGLRVLQTGFHLT